MSQIAADGEVLQVDERTVLSRDSEAMTGKRHCLSTCISDNSQLDPLLSAGPIYGHLCVNDRPENL